MVRRIVQKGPYFAQRLIVKQVAKPHIAKYRGKDNQGPEIFETVFFELRTRCNSHCTFCAGSVENEIRPDLNMPFAVFKKGIDNLKDIGFTGRVAFHITSEPLLTPNLPEYITYAREQLPKVWLQLLTNGRKLNPRSGTAVIDAGINEITVNYYDDACAANHDLPLPQNILKFESEVLTKRFTKGEVTTGHGPDPVKGFDVFRYNCNRRRMNEILSNQTGSSPNKSVMTERNFLGFCHSPLTDFHITTDGTVSKCSKDVFFTDPMGNIMEEDVMEIWNGKRFRDVHRMLLANDRNANEMCRGCDYPGFKTIHGKKDTLKRLLQHSIYGHKR
ncbi:MAG: SPASM domain-containing protein [Magnetococcales bacterium]|nr:SPASM domain-containing protein [Magnetococcales bacterium]